jgi:hypothetical protein
VVGVDGKEHREGLDGVERREDGLVAAAPFGPADSRLRDPVPAHKMMSR